MRPPIRSRPSRIVTSTPRSVSARAAARPAMPAPTTSTRLISLATPVPLTSSATDCRMRDRWLSGSVHLGAARKIAAQLVRADHRNVKRHVGRELPHDDPEPAPEEVSSQRHRKGPEQGAVEGLSDAELEDEVACRASGARNTVGATQYGGRSPVADDLPTDDDSVIPDI